MGTNYAIHVGVILKDHLDALGLTQKELCERIEVSTTVINELIKGKRNMNANLANKLADVFGLPAKYWMGIQADYDLAKESIDVKHLITGDDLLEAGYTAQDIADRFICYEREECKADKYYEPSLTHLKLQKLLYFAQKEFVKRGIILFKNPIKHWTYGPVVFSVYNRYKSSSNIIVEPVKESVLVEDIEKILKSVYNKYKKYTASYLVSLTHKEKTWINTSTDEIITPEMIRDSL